MFGIIKKMFAEPEPPRFDAPIVIDRPTYAVGDVHGRFDLLAPLVRAIARDAEESALDSPRVVFMGDYVDRGERSKEVVDYLLHLVGGNPAGVDGDVVMLRGNHEEMLLNFLSDPVSEGSRWLRNGGLQTLMSYGVGGVSTSTPPEGLEDAARRLSEAMGDSAMALRMLPSSALFGDVFFAHAGGDPTVPVGLQAERALIWGASSFRSELREDDKWVVHGHYVVDEADARLGRIAVDTGAFFSGRLTAARIMDGAVEFIQVEE